MSKPLKLKAETSEDLQVLSSLVQDAILRVGEIRYDAGARSLSCRMTRFRHESDKSQRVLTGLRIDGITKLRSRGVDRSDPEAMIVLLDIAFDPESDGPGGTLTLNFAGQGDLQAEIECLELILADVSEPRDTDAVPLHPQFDE